MYFLWFSQFHEKRIKITKLKSCLDQVQIVVIWLNSIILSRFSCFKTTAEKKAEEAKNKAKKSLFLFQVETQKHFYQ